jgi:ABC-type Fe3+/spermidine/putrescine transport system ATPase subunit
MLRAPPTGRAAHQGAAMTSIRLEGIAKEFPGVNALKDVNLEIAPGEFFTLLGPSGCGKTTLLRTIAGFYQQDAGHLYLDGDRIDAVPPHLRDTGMVFQSYAVFPHMNVFDNVAFGLRNRRVPRAEIGKRVARALEMARLSGYEKRTPDQLSGGQQQRVGLARAMVIEPRVLLMDEPLSNLDAKLRIEMRGEIRAMQRALGITTVYVTHDQEEALVISDRIAVMRSGVVQQVGGPWEVYKDPRNTFVAAFVGSMNFVDGEIEDGGEPVLRVGPHRIRAASLGGAGGKVRISFRPEELSLSARLPGASAAGGEAVGRLSGTLVSSTFTGPLVSYAVDCGSGVSVTVERHKPAAADILAVGTPVEVTVPPAAVLVFDAQTGGRL